MRTIAHLSDLHFGRHEPLVEEALYASLSGARPDLVVVSGDFTQRALKSQFQAARTFLDRLNLLKLVIPGNHDMPLYDIPARLFHPLENFRRYIAPAGIPGARHVDEEIAVLGLNTARRFTGKNGRVSDEQMEEIQRFFQAQKSGVTRILVTHHPLGSAEGHAKVEHAFRSDAALRAVEKAGVHLLLSGHHHQAASGEIDSEIADHDRVLIIHAGTAISNRLRGGEGNSYNLLAVERNRLKVTVMECHSVEGFRPLSETIFVFAAGRWKRSTTQVSAAAVPA
jgi:3',5'-cyclic AMP phosphodiesterase CpdA